jgi:hypothetical protein
MENQTQQDAEQKVNAQHNQIRVEKKSLPKWPLIITTIIIFATLFAGGAYTLNKNVNSTQKSTSKTVQTVTPTFTPTPTSKATIADPTVTWKTYINTSLNFSLILPTDINPVGVGMDNPTAEEASEVFFCNQCAKHSNPEITPSIYLQTVDLKYTIYKDLNADEIANKNYTANLANKNTFTALIKPLEKTEFAGIPAYSYTLDSKGYSGNSSGFILYPGIKKIIEFEHNGIYFIIVTSENSKLDQILSTFKFTQ